MSKPGAEQSVHSDWKATQIKVGDVLFAMVKEVDARPAASLKTSPELADLLRQQHDDVRPSKHLNKAHWSTVFLDGSLPDSQIYYLVDASYLQAVELLPERSDSNCPCDDYSNGLRKRAVCEASHSATVSGVPETRISPPPLPPSGPRSTIQSAVLITSRLCSITTMVLP
jgi:predicted DNA-binding protein (MmcQ/YjbR family)